MKILSLITRNFKKISSDKKIEFNKDINVLVWINNAGKTSILQAVSLAFNLPTNFNINDSIYYLIKDWVCEIEVEFLFNERQWEICLSQVKHMYKENLESYLNELLNQVLVQKLTLNIVNWNIKASDRILNLKKLLDNSLTRNEIVAFSQKALEIIKDQNFYNFFWTPLFIDSNRSITPNEQFRPIKEARQENTTWRIREKLYIIRKDNPEKFESIKKHILSVFLEIKDFTITHDEEKWQFSLQIKENLRKNWNFEDVNYDINNTWLWMQSLILIIANIFIQDSDIVLLDEPEIHMHPELVKKFVSIISRISNEKQIIITSHSVPLINSVKIEKIFSLKYIPEEKWVIIKPAKEEKDILEILNDIWFDVKNDIFSNVNEIKKIVFIEWKTDEKYLKLFAKKFNLQSNNFLIFEEMIWKWDSFKIAETIWKLKESKNKIWLSFLITIDKDEQNNYWIKEILDENEVFIWNKRQIENYLLDIKAISKLTLLNESENEEKLEKIIDIQKSDMLHRFIKELFFEWKLSTTKKLRDFLDENKWKNFEDYETGLEQMFLFNFIEVKNKTKKDIINLEKFFDEKWKKEKWQICDWKRVLKDFRREYNFSFSDEDVIENMEDCPIDIKDFWEKINVL